MLIDWDIETIHERVSAFMQSSTKKSETWRLASPWQWFKCFVFPVRFKDRHPIKVRKVIIERWKANGCSHRSRTVVTTKLLPTFIHDRNFSSRIRIKKWSRKIALRRLIGLEPKSVA